MKRISSQTTFLYQVIWPLFAIVCLLIMIKLSFSNPAIIALVVIFIIVCFYVIPMFFNLKDVWIENDNLIVSGILGEKITLHKTDIIAIKQNPTMITPRLVKIKLKSTDKNQFIRFIPKGGYWIFWQHEIVNELMNWLNEKASTQQRV